MIKPTFLLELRKANRLSQAFIAKSIGLSRQSYIEVEKGVKELTISQAQKIAEIFNISLETLIAGRKTSDIKVSFDKEEKKKETQEVRIDVPQKNLKKFKEVLLYILEKVGGKPNVGMTVLYKLLYFIDFYYYEKYENQLMGLVYLKNHHGPTPKLFEDLIGDMTQKGDVEVVKSKFYQYPQTKYLVNPVVEPDLSILNGKEQEHIDWELQRLSDMTASQLS